MKTTFFRKKFCDCVTLRPPDLITTLTYVRMDNICPCFLLLIENLHKNLEKCYIETLKILIRNKAILFETFFLQKEDLLRAL